jgi:hypothetical protein
LIEPTSGYAATSTDPVSSEAFSVTSKSVSTVKREEEDRPSGESPGNIVATYPFQVIAMDHIPSLPASYKGNTELLVWIDLFTGFAILKANAS